MNPHASEQRMLQRIELDDIPVDYQLIGDGDGDPVVLTHARPYVRWYAPLVGALRGRTVLRYWRTPPADVSFSIEDDARLCAALLAHVEMKHPHVVGHSYGGLVALELARQGIVEPRSLALLEPATSGLVEPAEAMSRMAPLLEMARVDGPRAAMEQFLRTICGADGRDTLERLVPGAVDDALAHADRFFTVELPAVIRWTFTPRDTHRIECPILAVHGADSEPRFAEGTKIIRTWFPTAVGFELPAATHLLIAQAPTAIAARLQAFWRST